ncbi:FkbM family methyltransferase [Sinobacterium caligoides]|uniref:FkbM family methyltransferase n=1 Tax=Sinobacterium caligoides TaxID=933926 RepID=A0A3N2DZ30_9GAMM|nr:FkbM family methyltransferase [Sinobacterium caligoides]ROS05064.1 FkbM family methyltransferase [Sinobacterium caligoides]
MAKSYPLKVAGLQVPVSMLVHEHADDTHVSRFIASDGVWEEYETQLIVERLQAGDVFIDVGANIGYYSALAAQCVDRSGHVFGFEPEPLNYALFAQNAALSGADYGDNVTAVNAALASQPGQGYLYLNEANRGDHQIYDDGRGRNKTAIELLHGDSYFDAIDPELKARVIKVDTQGAEIEVLTGLAKLVERSRQGLSLVIEFWPRGLINAGGNAHQLLDWLLALELSIFIIDQIDNRLIPATEADLRPWIDDLNNDASNEGFLNLLLENSI